MKAIAAALFLLAVLAMAEARPTMRVLNKKTKATASAVAVAKDGGSATSGASADAENGGVANADSLAYAAGPDADANSYADASAEDWAVADANSKAIAKGEDAYAKSYAGADAAGEVTADADSKAIALGAADATSKAYAYGDATAKSVAYAKAEPEEVDPEPKKYYYPWQYYHYYPKEDDNGDEDEDEHAYDPYWYYWHGFHGYKTVDPTLKYPWYGHYVIVDEDEVEEEEVEYTPVKFVDPAILAYYAQKVYDFGCFEGKYYRCTYDDSCGECPYGYFCGEKTEKVCEDVEVWVKKCDPAAPAKKCVPDLTPCGTGFCKFNEKCAADYYWCGAKWCTPKYACVPVAAPQKCIWELKNGEKVKTCTEFAPEACGEEACPVGYKCSEDPCTFEKKTVQKCEDKAVPVCVAFDIPIYKTLFSKCGPGYCHPGYKCESFDHDSCVVKVAVHPVYIGYKPHDPVVVSPDESDEDDKHVYLPYEPHYPVIPDDNDNDEDEDDSSASVTAKAVSVSTPDGVYSYTNVDADATGDGKAKGNADATATNGDSTATSWSGAVASAPETSAGAKSTADGDAAKAGADASADYNP